MSGIWKTICGSVWAGLVWRYGCHSVMLLLCLLNEGRAAPSLPDTILDIVPRLDIILEHNYLIWLACYVPVALVFWRVDRERFVRFLFVGGVLSLLRGLCIPLTGLGPVHGADVNVGLAGAELLSAWVDLVNPLAALFGDSAHVYMTKDLFFSGHTASTFLLFLYCRRHRWLGWVALAGHLLVVATVFLSHLHYTIDVIGAWAITFSVFTLVERGRGVGASAKRGGGDEG